MPKIPYLIEYNGETPQNTYYNGKYVGVVLYDGVYMSATGEATYLSFTNTGETSQAMQYNCSGNDTNKAPWLDGSGDKPPRIFIKNGGTFSRAYGLSPNERLYYILTTQNRVTDIHPYSSKTGNQQTNRNIQVEAYIGGKCTELYTACFSGMTIKNIEFSPNFKGALTRSCLTSPLLQNSIDFGNPSTVGQTIISTTMPDTNMSFTFGEDTIFTGYGCLTLTKPSGSTEKYTITVNLPGVQDNTYKDFSTSTNFYPLVQAPSTDVEVIYNFSESLDFETAQIAYPGLFYDGKFRWRAGTNNYPEATVNFNIPAKNVRFNAEECTINPPEKVNVSAEFCSSSVLGNSTQREIINGFVLGKSRLGDGAVLVKEYPYYVGRYIANEYGTFNTPYTIHLETKTATKTLTLMFDEQNDYHPTYISYSYMTSAGESKIRTNADNTSRVTLTFDEPTKEIDITISTWNMPGEALLITGIYAGEPNNE